MKLLELKKILAKKIELADRERGLITMMTFVRNNVYMHDGAVFMSYTLDELLDDRV